MRNLLFIASLCFLISCNTATKKEATKDNTSKAVEKIKEEVGEDGVLSDATIEKYNVFISFINTTSKSAESSYNRYAEAVDPYIGVTGKERHIDLYKITTHATEKLETYIDKKPSFKNLDNAGKEAVEAAKKLEKVVLEAYEYYGIKGYKDDQFSKAKELHPKLMNAFEYFFEKDSVLYAELDVLATEIKEAELARYKKEGLDLLYAKSMLLEKTRNVITAIEGNSVETINKIDKDSYITAFNDLLKAYNDFTEKASDEERVEREIGKFKKIHLSSFKNSVRKFIVDSRELKERLENNDFTLPSSYRFNKNAEWVKGSPEKLRNKFGEIVNDYNRMN